MLVSMVQMTVNLHTACAGGACAGTIAVNLLAGIFPDHAPPACAVCGLSRSLYIQVTMQHVEVGGLARANSIHTLLLLLVVIFVVVIIDDS